MDAQLARQFRERWQAVAAVEAEEQMAATLDLRWQQLNAIARLAIGLRLPLIEVDRQEEVVRQRWVKLKSSQV
jgi:hypothetical protein